MADGRTGPRIGSLFSGAGGLDMAVEAVFGGHVIWHSEIDPAASKVLAHYWPDVPNLGDISKVDWATVPPVDVLCGGFPCQDVSAAGKRAGIKDGTRSGLWSVFAEAIDQLRPQFVVIENVRGLLSATAHRTEDNDEQSGDMEPATAAMGNGTGRPVLRAAGAVLGDLADLGYDAQWATVAAADVGAPHRRERVFILATAADADSRRLWWERTASRSAKGVKPEALAGTERTSPTWTAGADVSDPSRNGWVEGRPEPARLVGGFDAAVSGDEPGVALLPTPQAHDSQGPKTQEQIATMRAKGAGVRNLNETAVHELLSTPQSRDHKGRPSDGFNQANLCRDVEDLPPSSWGKYAPAIYRWRCVINRVAPPPTEPNKNGNPRLAAPFSEWMMGWPAGHVTDPAIGISRNDQLRIIGNGVVPQQAAHALRFLLAVATGTLHTHTHTHTASVLT